MKQPCEYVDIAEATGTIILDSGRHRFEWNATAPGTFKLSGAKHVKFYAMTNWKNNGHLSLMDGTGRVISKWPSLFTGSFCLEGYAEGGLYVRVGAVGSIAPKINITWYEQDA